MVQSSIKSGHEQYRKIQAQTGSRADLVLMLYQGSIRFMNRALAKLDANDIEGTHNALIRAQDIISELQSTLDLEIGGQMASHLSELYKYCVGLLIDGNMQKQAAPIIEAKRLIQELEGAWEEALKLNGSAGSNNSA